MHTFPLKLKKSTMTKTDALLTRLDEIAQSVAAMRFIQGYAVDRILDLAPLLANEQLPIRDPFAWPVDSRLLPTGMTEGVEWVRFFDAVKGN